MSNSLEEDLEQLYIDGYKKGRADERERCVQAVNQVPIIERGYEYSAGLNDAIEAIKAE